MRVRTVLLTLLLLPSSPTPPPKKIKLRWLPCWMKLQFLSLSFKTLDNPTPNTIPLSLLLFPSVHPLQPPGVSFLPSAPCVVTSLPLCWGHTLGLGWPLSSLVYLKTPISSSRSNCNVAFLYISASFPQTGIFLTCAPGHCTCSRCVIVTASHCLAAATLWSEGHAFITLASNT